MAAGHNKIVALLKYDVSHILWLIGSFLGVILAGCLISWYLILSDITPSQEYLPLGECWLGIARGAMISLVSLLTLRILFPVWRRKWFLGFISLVAIASSVVEGGLIAKGRIQRRFAPFEIYLKNSSFGLSSAQQPAISGHYIHGKILTICSSRGRDAGVCPLFLKLPESLRPLVPAEVETIAYIDYDFNKVGVYIPEKKHIIGERVGDALQRSCTVTLTDLLNHVIAPPKLFLGVAPPASFRAKPGESAGAAGPNPPDSDIVRYIQGLPKR